MEREKRPDWKEVRHVYELGAMKVEEICKTFRVSRSALYHRAKKEQWVPRAKPRRCQREEAGERTDFHGMLGAAKGRVTGQFKDQTRSAADLERHVRMVKSLISAEKLMNDMEKAKSSPSDSNKEKSQATKGGGKKGELDDDADAIRRELARRLNELGKNGKD